LVVVCASWDDDRSAPAVRKVALVPDLEWSVESLAREIPARKMNFGAVLKGEVAVDVDVV
jgi:hypothetical protein